jgi:hypothetical protein
MPSAAPACGFAGLRCPRERPRASRWPAQLAPRPSPCLWRAPRTRAATVASTLHPTPCTPSPYTLHPTPYTLQAAPCTLHPTPAGSLRFVWLRRAAPHTRCYTYMYIYIYIYIYIYGEVCRLHASSHRQESFRPRNSVLPRAFYETHNLRFYETHNLRHFAKSTLRAICTVLLDPRDSLLQSERMQGFIADPVYGRA